MVSWSQIWLFCFFLLILPKIYHFCMFKSSYAFQSIFLVLFCLHNYFFSPFMDLQCVKLIIDLKIADFVFLTHILQKNCPSCMIKSSYGPPMPFKVYVWYCFVCTTTFSVHLWIYSVSNGKLASKLSGEK